MKKIAKSIKKPKKKKVIRIKKEKAIKVKKEKKTFVKDQKCGRCGINLLKKDFAKHWRSSHRVQSAKQHKVLAEG